MQQNEFDKLVQKYLDGTATALEKRLVDEHLRVLEGTGINDLSQENIDRRKAAVLARLRKQMTVTAIPIYRKVWFRAAAAVIIVGTAAMIYLLFGSSQKQKQQIAIATNTDQVAPGHDAAVLTLDNGRQIILDSASDGNIASQEDLNVLKKNGTLVYKGAANAAMMNTVSTNRGNQWSVILPDSTRVWLNAASSIRYSLNFTGNKREVTTTGEVYFEVAKDASRPFHVKTGDIDITVLGTHFNVNAYTDEPCLRTSLLEGSVVITKGTQTIKLRPGQQAVSMNQGELTKKDNADMEQVMAWKSGFFEFRNMNMSQIMRQISRWYDVDIVYEGQPGDETFGGRISKNVNLAVVLKALAITGAKFRLENKKLFVRP